MIAIDLTPERIGALVELVGALLLFAASLFVLPWLRHKARTAKTEDMRKAYLGAIDKLEAVIGPSVRATEQTVARKLRAAEPEPGKLDATQAEAALSHAVGLVLAHFGDEQLDEIAAALGRSREDLDKVIRARIEAGLLDLRHRAASPAIDVAATVRESG